MFRWVFHIFYAKTAPVQSLVAYQSLKFFISITKLNIKRMFGLFAFFSENTYECQRAVPAGPIGLVFPRILWERRKNVSIAMSVYLFSNVCQISTYYVRKKWNSVSKFSSVHTTFANMSWSSLALTALLTLKQDWMPRANKIYRKRILIPWNLFNPFKNLMKTENNFTDTAPFMPNLITYKNTRQW